ncbi:hypothetical protein Tco_0839924 [Tanacetum coccineum]|uniref:Uncharacterized protein n=1 Tax=Tanacetum coccineum TaxID=301880 RepID=A0ABQ5AUK3_9ASTR
MIYLLLRLHTLDGVDGSLQQNELDGFDYNVDRIELTFWRMTLQRQDGQEQEVVAEMIKPMLLIGFSVPAVLRYHCTSKIDLSYAETAGSSKNYKIFSEMLDDFDRQDVLDLHRLVQERYDATSPEGYDLLLWEDLKILFEPNEEDEIWKNQQDYNLISWRLFDSCGIHMLLTHTGIAIHMMIEKKYPLTQEMLSRMLSRRLEVDQESEMAYELLTMLVIH